jgi:hypothetical protein
LPDALNARGVVISEEAMLDDLIADLARSRSVIVSRSIATSEFLTRLDVSPIPADPTPPPER